MVFAKVKRHKIHEDVASQIEDAIISGELVEGENLPSERDLMATFAVGRPAVREALLLLENNGFVRLSVGERARITRPTVAAIVDQLSSTAKHLLASAEGNRAFQDARRVFESAIARNAAVVATPSDIAHLREKLEENRAAIGEMTAFERTDVAFHLALAEIGNNPVFGALHKGITEWLAFQRHIALRVGRFDERSLESHQQIFDAVAAHDPEAAHQAMDQHLTEVMEHYARASGDSA